MSLLRIGVLCFGLVASVASTLNPNDDFAADECGLALEAVVGRLEIVNPGDDALMQDYEVHDLIFGDQGGEMVAMRFRVSGDEVPGCMEITLDYEKCLDTECLTVDPDSSTPYSLWLRTYEDGPSRITKSYLAEMRYPLRYGDLVRATATAGQQGGQAAGSVLMWLGEEGAFEPPGLDAGF